MKDKFEISLLLYNRKSYKLGLNETNKNLVNKPIFNLTEQFDIWQLNSLRKIILKLSKKLFLEFVKENQSELKANLCLAVTL